jgi:IMP cyclohydrolase
VPTVASSLLWILSINEMADFYWERINAENKIALLVKFINVSNQDIQFQIRNKHSTNG